MADRFLARQRCKRPPGTERYTVVATLFLSSRRRSTSQSFVLLLVARCSGCLDGAQNQVRRGAAFSQCLKRTRQLGGVNYVEQGAPDNVAPSSGAEDAPASRKATASVL